MHQAILPFVTCLASLREPSPLKLQRNPTLAYVLPAGPKSQYRIVQAHTWPLLRALDLGKNADSAKLVHTGSARCTHTIPGQGTQGVLSYVPKLCPCPHSLNYSYTQQVCLFCSALLSILFYFYSLIFSFCSILFLKLKEKKETFERETNKKKEAFRTGRIVGKVCCMKISQPM